MTITEFLLARIAEDEAAVLDGWDSSGKARIATMWVGERYTTVASDQGDDYWIANGEHIDGPRHVHVLFDPARVLAECEAKRRIVDWHALVAGAGPGGEPVVGCANCVGVENGESFTLAGPCVTLRLLATVHSDHPDYDPAWRP